MLTISGLYQLLSKGESVSLECKEAKVSVPRSIYETYSAFANTNGGVMVLGVKEKPEKNSKEKFTIVGVEDPAKIIDDFWNTINSAKVNVNLLVDSNVYPLTIDDKTVVIIEVPRADCTQKPVYVGDNPIKGTYRRNGSGDYHCIENEIKAMFRDQVEEPRDRKLFYPGLSINDLESESIKRYRQLFNTSHDKHAWSEIDDKSFLKNIGAYKVTDTNEGPTLAGLLMFGSHNAIVENIGGFFMDYIDKTTPEIGIRWNDRLSVDELEQGNIYNFVSKVVPKLTSELQNRCEIVNMIRVDNLMLRNAIREAFVNAVVHADYQGVLPTIVITKFDDGFSFENSGTLRLPIDKIYECGISSPRNPTLFSMFRAIGFCERFGSGFPLIVEACKKYGYQEPLLTEDLQIGRVTLKIKKVVKHHLSYNQDEQEQQVLALIAEDPKISLKKLSVELGTSLYSVKMCVQRLKEKRRLCFEGHTRGGLWIIRKE